jgi:hypothetical protein
MEVYAIWNLELLSEAQSLMCHLNPRLRNILLASHHHQQYTSTTCMLGAEKWKLRTFYSLNLNYLNLFQRNMQRNINFFSHVSGYSISEKWQWQMTLHFLYLLLVSNFTVFMTKYALIFLGRWLIFFYCHIFFSQPLRPLCLFSLLLSHFWVLYLAIFCLKKLPHTVNACWPQINLGP